jgi:hypothetical protein
MENEVSGNEICPKCERKRLYYRGAFKTWRCAKCKSFFDINKNYLGIDDQENPHNNNNQPNEEFELTQARHNLNNALHRLDKAITNYNLYIQNKLTNKNKKI